MIAGHFDLSVGTIVGLTGWAMYYFGNVLGLPPILTIVCTLAVGTLLGAVNGVIQVRTGLPSFIITLATSLVYRGILTMNTSGFPVVVKFPASYAQLIAGKLFFGYRMSVALVPRRSPRSLRCSCCARAWETGPSQSGKIPPLPRILACRSLARL